MSNALSFEDEKRTLKRSSECSASFQNSVDVTAVVTVTVTDMQGV